MTHLSVMSSHKPIRIYMRGLILGVNTLFRLFCFFKMFPMVGKGLNHLQHSQSVLVSGGGVMGSPGRLAALAALDEALK